MALFCELWYTEVFVANFFFALLFLSSQRDSEADQSHDVLQTATANQFHQIGRAVRIKNSSNS
jgi:hypothetical protein